MKLTIGGRISSIKIVFGIQTLSSAVPFGSDLKQLSYDVFLRQKNAAPTNTPVAATPASTIPVMVPLPIPSPGGGNSVKPGTRVASDTKGVNTGPGVTAGGVGVGDGLGVAVGTGVDVEAGGDCGVLVGISEGQVAPVGMPLSDQRPEVHYYAFGDEFVVLVEVIKGDERQFDVAARSFKSLEFTDMFAAQASLDNDFVLCQMFGVDIVVKVFKSAVRAGKTEKAVRITNALRVRERDAVVKHLSVEGEGRHNTIHVVVVFNVIVGLKQGSATGLFAIGNGHGSSSLLLAPTVLKAGLC